jgi:hypothetical protein
VPRVSANISVWSESGSGLEVLEWLELLPLEFSLLWSDEYRRGEWLDRRICQSVKPFLNSSTNYMKLIHNQSKVSYFLFFLSVSPQILVTQALRSVCSRVSRILALWGLLYNDFASSSNISSENNLHMHWIVPLLYSIYRFLHVSAVICHHQGPSWIRLSYLKCRSNRWYII